MELRSPDPACNPYVAYTLLLRAGLDGINRRLPLCPACDINFHAADAAALEGLERLPSGLEEAIAAARESAFVQSALPEQIREAFFAIREEECRRCAEADQSPGNAAYAVLPDGMTVRLPRKLKRKGGNGRYGRNPLGIRLG